MYEDIESIMSEGPGGETSSADEFLSAGGWGIATLDGGGRDGGLVAHRGVVHPEEYVDADILRDAACEALGFSYEEITSVYRQGPLAPEQRQLREKIDARLLALSHAGGNMRQLAQALAINEKTLDRALNRARDRWVEPVVKNPAVVKPLMCFIEGTMDAKPRRRRYKGCPASMLPLPQYRDGTINLSARAYARGA